MSRKVLIIDGYNMIHRCRFQWGGGLASGDNQIVYNFFRTLRSCVEQFNPDIVYFPLDGKPSKRLAISDDYKATRKIVEPTQEEIDYWDDFRRQKRFIISSLQSYYPITTVYHKEHECDDLVFYLIDKYHSDDEVVVLSSDTDFIQILNSYPESVSLYNPVSKKFRENTDYDYVSWKAMVGDKADNIPGVKGIGKKTALKILSKDGELEERLKNPIFKESYDKSYSLIKFLDLTEDEEGIEILKGNLDKEGIVSKFEELGFSSMLKESYLKNYINTFDL